MRGELRGVLLVVVLVLSCVAGGACIPGTILGQTLLQLAPGQQAQQAQIRATLNPGEVVDVACRTQDALVYDDPWWLDSTYFMLNGTSTTGWVADYYVDCGNAGNCNVTLCA